MVHLIPIALAAGVLLILESCGGKQEKVEEEENFIPHPNCNPPFTADHAQVGLCNPTHQNLVDWYTDRCDFALNRFSQYDEGPDGRACGEANYPAEGPQSASLYIPPDENELQSWCQIDCNWPAKRFGSSAITICQVRLETNSDGDIISAENTTADQDARVDECNIPTR